jgi:superfamily II DNA helicase RecQ
VHPTQDLLALLEPRRGQCGVVYARLRATCDWLAGALCDAGFEAGAYHAGKDTQQRSRVRSPAFCSSSTAGSQRSLRRKCC